MTTVMKWGMNWMNANRAVYFGNATAMRDFRVQLRGNRSVLLFGAYLLVLICVAMIVYGQAIGDRAISIVDAQEHLQSFYTTVMALLAGTICVVAPALCATTVVAERQRHSFDLIFSAPVTPKYYLVGKMLSTYRYIWMLLVLSVPVTATCVMLGGASWSDVLGSYAMLSFQSLILTSLALMVSTFASKPVTAVFLSYAVTLPCIFGIAAVSEGSLYVAKSVHSMQAPFFVALDPFGVDKAIGTYASIGALAIPNWLIGIGVAFAISKIALLCAGSILSPTGKEARSLRAHGLVYSTFGLGLLGYAFYDAVGWSQDPSAILGRAYFWAFIPLCAIVPFMACYGLDSENRLRPDGLFKLRNLLSPTPATALPYLWTLFGCSAVGVLGGYLLAAASSAAPTGVGHAGMLDMSVRVSSGPYMQITGLDSGAGPVLSTSFFAYVAFTIALWTFFWSIGRFASALSLGVRAARGITFSAFLLICATPVPVLFILEMWQGLPSGNGLWNLWVLRSAVDSTSDAPTIAITYSIILMLLALPIAFYSETKLKALVGRRKVISEKVPAAA